MAPNSGISPEIEHTPSVVLGIWKTEPPEHYRCPPATKLTAEISWEPVFLPLLERLAELHFTPEAERWPGTNWPTEAAFNDAVSFTERLPIALKAAPHISLADDGEVNFAWSRGGMRIDLGFYGTGTFSYYARDKEGKELFGDEMSVTSPLPKQLRELMTR